MTLWTVARQASLSMGFSRQEYWSGLPCSPLGDLPDPGIKPSSPVLQAVSLLHLLKILFCTLYTVMWTSLVAQLVKNPPTMQEAQVRFPGWEDPLEEGMTTHSSILGLPWLLRQ